MGEKYAPFVVAAIFIGALLGEGWDLAVASLVLSGAAMFFIFLGHKVNYLVPAFSLRRPVITKDTPGCIIKLFGWMLLALNLVVVIIRAHRAA